MNILFLLQLVSTLYMVGLIWFVQIVHYPMYALVGRANFIDYQRAHQLRTTLVVGPMMLIEAATTVAIVYWPPTGMGPYFTWSGVILLFVVWFSTALLQVPCHHKLSSGFSEEQLKVLVFTNWIRTIAWSGRGALLIAYLSQVLPV